MCLNPNYAKFYFDSNGERKVKFIGFWDYLGHEDDDMFFTLPCGKCPECLELYSQEWAFRVLCELKQYNGVACFLTLTYNDDNLPMVGENGSLCKDDYQKFLKRLRKKFGNDVRYFGCGEYGSNGLRPHYHFILFGVIPEDLKFFKITKKKEKIYISDIISSLWDKGFVSVGKVTYKTAKYCAKYMQKLNSLPDGVEKPFTCMSLKPGLGLQYFLDHKTAFLQCDSITFADDNFKLHSFHIPRYFLRKCSDDEIKDLKSYRKVKGKLLFNQDSNNTRYDKLLKKG